MAVEPTFKRKMLKISIFTGLSLIVIFSIVVYFKYYLTYSDGSRSGMLQKISHKGMLFKTFEGELILNSFSTSNKTSVITPEKFLFSVTNENVAKELEALQGQEIVVIYEQKNNSVFWRGESEYIVTDVRKR